jgi:hypothetical protein
MDTMRICKQCQQPLPENDPEGLCPACLARVALGSEPATPGATININPLAQAAPDSRVVPNAAQLAAQFPQLEIIELLGMGSCLALLIGTWPSIFCPPVSCLWSMGGSRHERNAAFPCVKVRRPFDAASGI